MEVFRLARADGSVDAFERFLKVGERLSSLHLSPQGHRPPLQPANRLEAIAFDHSLDIGKAIVCVGGAPWHHSVSVRPTAAATLSPIAQGWTGRSSGVCSSTFLGEAFGQPAPRPVWAGQKTSLRQYNTSSPDSGGSIGAALSIRTIMISVEGLAEAIVTCGGRKRGGSHARIVGRRSDGSRAISACRRAPTRAPEASRSPHSSIVHVCPATLTTTYAAAVMPSSAMKKCSCLASVDPRPASRPAVASW